MPKAEEPQLSLEDWLQNKGQSPWEPGYFKTESPATAAREAFAKFCAEAKPSKSEREASAAWALWQACLDTTELLAQRKEECDCKEAQVLELKYKCEQLRREKQHVEEAWEAERLRGGHPAAGGPEAAAGPGCSRSQAKYAELQERSVQLEAEKVQWHTQRRELNDELSKMRQDLEEGQLRLTALLQANREDRETCRQLQESYAQCQLEIERLRKQAKEQQALVAAQIRPRPLAEVEPRAEGEPLVEGGPLAEEEPWAEGGPLAEEEPWAEGGPLAEEEPWAEGEPRAEEGPRAEGEPEPQPLLQTPPPPQLPPWPVYAASQSYGPVAGPRFEQPWPWAPQPPSQRPRIWGPPWGPPRWRSSASWRRVCQACGAWGRAERRGGPWDCLPCQGAQAPERLTFARYAGYFPMRAPSVLEPHGMWGPAEAPWRSLRRRGPYRGGPWKRSHGSGPAPGSWQCPQCGGINYAHRLDCYRCHTPRGDSELATPP